MNKNKTILIIGAKSDIAIAIAHKFASNGYNLQLAARNFTELDQISNDIKIRYNSDVKTYELNILNYKSFNKFVKSLKPLPAIVVCSVGLLGDQKKDEKNLDCASLVIRTNFEGPSLLLGEIANFFEKRGYGSIIGISSVAGDRGRASNYIYGSAKAGFSTNLSGLRNRLNKSNVRVLSVLPGFVKTKMTKNIKLPNLISSNPSKIANLVFRNSSKSKVLYPFPWSMIMFIVKLIPERIFINLKL
jgi:short-subunit dehydrogenase